MLARVGTVPITGPCFVTGGSTCWALHVVPGSREVPFDGLIYREADPRTAIVTCWAQSPVTAPIFSGGPTWWAMHVSPVPGDPFDVLMVLGADPRTACVAWWALSPVTAPIFTGGPTWWAKHVSPVSGSAI